MVRTYDTEETAPVATNWATRAIVAAIISLILGLIATWIAGFIIAFPWEFGTALLAVGVASFGAAFFSVLLSHPRRAP